MNNQKIALLAIPVFAAIMIGAIVSPAYGGEPGGDCEGVSIDIKPQSDPNSINIFANGIIPVAILGSEDCSVFAIDPDTLAFEGASPIHRNFPHLSDVNGDGLLDLVSHYRTQDTGIVFGDTEACLTGDLIDAGNPFEACDDIRTFPDL